MKKLLTLLIFAWPLLSVGQFNFGLRLGGNMHNLVLEPAAYKAGAVKLGVVGGVFFRADSENQYFQVDGLFSQRHSAYTLDNLLTASDTTILNHVDFIDIPVFYGLRMGDHFRIGTGPVFYVLNEDRVSYEVDNYEASVSVDQNIFKQLNLGWQAGLCVDIPNFLFELRYEIGFSHMIKAFQVPETDIIVEPKARSNMWQLSVGYKFL